MDLHWIFIGSASNLQRIYKQGSSNEGLLKTPRTNRYPGCPKVCYVPELPLAPDISELSKANRRSDKLILTYFWAYTIYDYVGNSGKE